MKIRKRIIALILMIMATPSLVSAAIIDVICPDKIKENTDFTCNVRAISDANINNVIVKYRYSDKISYKSIELKDNWTFLVEDNPSATKFGIKNQTEKVGDISLADITFSAPSIAGEDLYIEFYGFDATNENADIIYFNNNSLRKNIHVKSNNNNLKTLTIDGENIGLTENTNYSYNTNKNNITITAELSDTNATCENIIRTVNLVNGNNIIEYNVIAEDGSTKIYKINIVYAESKESEVRPNPNTNQTNRGTNNTNNANTISDTNNATSDDNSNNNSTNNIIDNNQDIEKKNEEELTEDITKKEQKEKKENSKDIKQTETEKTEKKDTDKKKLKINVVLIVISIVIIALSIIIIKKNWGSLYKN